MTTQEILAIPMKDNDVEARTIGEYLAALFTRLWDDAEEFNAKKPFGNSGWQGPIYMALTEAGIIEGDMLEDEEVFFGNWQKADELITNCIREVFSPTK